MQCFELITETELQSAQRAMSNEMEPQIKELIARAEDGIEVLKKREKSLKAKASSIPTPELFVQCVLTVLLLLSYRSKRVKSRRSLRWRRCPRRARRASQHSRRSLPR